MIINFKLVNLLSLVLLTLTTYTAIAENPYKKFSTKKNLTNSSSIYWEQVDNIQEACNKQRQRLKQPPYKYKVEACSTWKKNFFFQDVCHIITEKNVNLWTIGHEIRHCFQGEFHK